MVDSSGCTSEVGDVSDRVFDATDEVFAGGNARRDDTGERRPAAMRWINETDGVRERYRSAFGCDCRAVGPYGSCTRALPVGVLRPTDRRSAWGNRRRAPTNGMSSATVGW